MNRASLDPHRQLQCNNAESQLEDQVNASTSRICSHDTTQQEDNKNNTKKEFTEQTPNPLAPSPHYKQATMVCPYRAVTGLITAAMSIMLVSSTFAADVDQPVKEQPKKSKKTPMSTEARGLLVAVLVLFHVDLFTTGYVRLGVKELIFLAKTSINH